MTPVPDFPGLYAETAFQCFSHLERDYVMVIRVWGNQVGRQVSGFIETPIEYFMTPDGRQGFRRRQGPQRLELWEVVAPNIGRMANAPSRRSRVRTSKSPASGRI